MRRALVACCAVALAIAAPARAGLVPGVTIDATDISALGGVALAEDSSGAVVYLRDSHVFVSLLSRGVWGQPLQVDPGVASAASQPQLAVTDGGRVAVVWVSGGELWGAVHPVGGASFSAPQAIAPALSDPSISMSLSGTAYVSWTAPDGAGTDVDAARLDRTTTQFTPLAGPLNSNGPATMAGSGVLRSSVAVASDTIGIVAWGEMGSDGRTHVLLRRVYGLSESTVTIDATVPALDGEAGHSADTPVVAVGDDSSYPWVAFRQTFDNGAGQTSRVVLENIIGSQLQPPVLADSLSFPAADGADAPALAVDGGADGLFAAALTESHAVIGSTTTPTGWAPGEQLNPFADALAPAPVVALGRDDEGVLAWEPDGGSVQGRLFEAGDPAEQETFSNSALGPVDVGAGLSAAQDSTGDSVVAFVQGTPARIAVGAWVPAPGAFHGLTSGAQTSTRPVLRWTAASDSWSAVHYTVLIDGVTAATIIGTHYQPKTALKAGVYRWQVLATDSLGQKRTAPVLHIRVK
jgi:hypothetical protein